MNPILIAVLACAGRPDCSVTRAEHKAGKFAARTKVPASLPAGYLGYCLTGSRMAGNVKLWLAAMVYQFNAGLPANCPAPPFHAGVVLEWRPGCMASLYQGLSIKIRATGEAGKL